MTASPQSAEDDLSCPICFKLFEDPYTPKNLLCGHVLCEVCLKEMATGKCQRTCPECRKIVRIPDEETASFSTNFRLRSLAENHKKSQMSPKKGGVPFCPDHEDERIYYYCVTCNKLACQVCINLKHNATGHNIEGVKEMYGKQKAEMKYASTKVKSKIAEVKNVLRELKTAEIQSAEFYQNVEKQIDKCIESQMNELLSRGEELKTQVERVKQSQAASLNRESETVEKQINAANESYQAAVSASENLSDYEYVTQHTQLINKMEDIQISKATTLSDVRRIQQDVIKFVPRSPHTTIGHIISVTQGKVRAIKPVQTLAGFTQTSCVDCTSDGLLAVTDFHGEMVVIYHKVYGKYKKKLDLKLTQGNQYKPSDIAICPDGRFMVARYTCIEVYSSDGNHQNDNKIQGSRWGLGKVNVDCVKVISDGRILVADYNKSLIVEMSSSGDFIRTIHISIKPRFMTLIHDTHIAMSDWKAGKVIVIDRKSGQQTLSVNITGVQGICYDEHTECLLTVRSEPAGKPGKVRLNTGVIEQYSYTAGKLIACLQQGLYNPLGMALTTDGHLVVANVKTVEIYEIQ